MYHKTLLDSDLYKFTMMQAICTLYPDVMVQYEFINRDNRPFPIGFDKQLQNIVNGFSSIRLTSEEYTFIKDKCYYLTPFFLDFLRGYKYDPSEVTITQNGNQLKVNITGYWYRTVLWEVPLMAAISELYFEMNHLQTDPKTRFWTRTKAQGLAGTDVFYSEFGTRRRFSYQNQDEVIQDLLECGKGHMIGTSNVHFAMKYHLTPMGTLAHEFIQAHGAMFGYKMANKMAMDAWIKTYKGSLGIALTDTYTSKIFFNSFDTEYAKLFDGIRQDSGSPIEFIKMAIPHYEKLRINPLSKTILFSDNLNLGTIQGIHSVCRDRIQDRYGIGTWLTNDTGNKPLNIVIKMIACNYGQGWVPTVKLSDSDTKHTGDSEEVRRCKETLAL